MKKSPPRVGREKRSAQKVAKTPVPSNAVRKLREKPCPVVGVGASAGGLEAFLALLEHLPANTGLAYAFVQHLAPTRESHLPHILSRVTRMRVFEATNGIHMEPDCVYVVPPNASMSVSDGTLVVGSRPGGRERHLPIDHFFQSLAAHRGNKAIGVVLSGTASDGTLGLTAIKVADGITFAQSEDSAKFPGMPRSAIAAGCVDFVLPPEQIAGELARLGSHPYLSARNEKERETAAPGDTLKRIFKRLRTATGVDFAGYRLTTIRRRIQRRVTVQRRETMEDYLKLLEKDSAEVQALFHDLLIHVTNFFREPETFAALSTHVFPELLKNRPPDDPIRIWLPGCATGEEAYSLAMSLVEFLGEGSGRPSIQIFGTDVSDPVIDAARRGIFGAGIEADVSPARLRRFFVKVEGGYQVAKSIRELCVFARQNVIQDPPFSKLDLISCRNVLIYFEPALQRKLIPVFHYALKSPGYLLLGSAETATTFKGLFSIVDPKNKIFLKRHTGSANLPHMLLGADFHADPGAPQEPDAAPARTEVWSRLDVLKAADRLLLARFSPPALLIDESMEIIQFRGEVAPYLNPAMGEASLNLFKMAHSALATELRSALLAARKVTGAGKQFHARIPSPGPAREVTMEVVRLDPPTVKERCFIILFSEAPPVPKRPATTALAAKNGRGDDARMVRLEEELTNARGQVQALMEEHEATNEELRSANEEIQSSNEELQSTNEELETAKEELQSTNEELMTLNDELKHNNDGLNELNDDLSNLLRTVNLPVVMLGRDLRIRRFTPAAQRLFKFIATDVGRAITDIKSVIDVPDLESLVREVIESLSMKERELQDPMGCWFRLQVRPYETSENKIAGAVLILFDIDAAKRASERLKHMANYADAIVETVTVPLLVLDGALKVKKATSAFCQQFKVRMDATEGHSLFKLGNGQWNIPALRSLLEGVLPKNTRVDNFKVEHEFPKIGKKTMLLNARRVESAGGEEPLIVFSITETRP